MNPFSESSVERGTKTHPFKSLALPFLLFQNFINFIEEDANIFVMELSITRISPGIAYIAHLNNFTLKTYTDSIYSPRASTVEIVDTLTDIFSPKSLFILLNDSSSNLNEILLNPTLSPQEVSFLNQTNKGFMVDKTAMHIEDINVISKVSSSNFTLVNAIYLEAKSIELINVGVEGYGTILESSTPLNLNVTNVNIDYFNMKGGFKIQSS